LHKALQDTATVAKIVQTKGFKFIKLFGSKISRIERAQF